MSTSSPHLCSVASYQLFAHLQLLWRYCFCHRISSLFLGADILNLHFFFINYQHNKVILNVNVFGPDMIDRVFFIKSNALVLSLFMSVALCSYLASSKNRLSHTTSLDACVLATASTSHEDRAMVLCFLLLQFTAPLANKKTYPLMLLVSGHPPQSESM